MAPGTRGDIGGSVGTMARTSCVTLDTHGVAVEDGGGARPRLRVPRVGFEHPAEERCVDVEAVPRIKGSPSTALGSSSTTSPDREISVATITARLFSALDGVVDPGVGNWHFPYFNDEMGEAVARTHDADVMLSGASPTTASREPGPNARPPARTTPRSLSGWETCGGSSRPVAHGSSPGATRSSFEATSSRPSRH